jgi:hypothetical protein
MRRKGAFLGIRGNGFFRGGYLINISPILLLLLAWLCAPQEVIDDLFCLWPFVWLVGPALGDECGDRFVASIGLSLGDSYVWSPICRHSSFESRPSERAALGEQIPEDDPKAKRVTLVIVQPLYHLDCTHLA